MVTAQTQASAGRRSAALEKRMPRSGCQRLQLRQRGIADDNDHRIVPHRQSRHPARHVEAAPRRPAAAAGPGNRPPAPAPSPAAAGRRRRRPGSPASRTDPPSPAPPAAWPATPRPGMIQHRRHRNWNTNSRPAAPGAMVKASTARRRRIRLVENGGQRIDPGRLRPRRATPAASTRSGLVRMMVRAAASWAAASSNDPACSGSLLQS